ncbi:PREDICTED: uncharacterized protein LOC108577040 [Habropoda laboriosa]|uniref:uncharacterized protein LOC108577040 n=1 Tax=Habropoda laboriosa TaxID=597456 RepID=UPI00083DF6B2|nr:PREDICTED: uncharacterized protein LOC108577040 [Habropoda laboriosa]
MYKLKQHDDYFDIMIDKSLQGIARVHSGLIVLEGCNAILRKDYMNMSGKVKLISGGKVGNELIYTEFVGPGMLTAAVFGNSHSAPPVDNILNVIEEIGVNHSPGILLIVQNYAEYPINFTLAKVYAEAKGYTLKIIIINNNNMPHFEFENVPYKEYKEEIFSNIAKEILKPITDTLDITSQNKTSICKTKIFSAGHEVAIMINHFGCNAVQTNACILELLKQIEINNLKVKRIYVKQLITHSNNRGFHICLLNLSFNTVLIKYLDFPTPVPAWPKILTSKIIGIGENDETKLTTSGKYCKNVDWSNINLQGPIINHENSQIFLSVISMACKAIIACTKQLNKMDQEFGDGNYGTSLACGAKAIQDAIQKNEILGTSLYVTFTQISHIIQRTMNGLQGGLYSLFFYNIAKAFSEYQSDEEVTANMWLHVLITANKAIEQFKIWCTGDQALLTVLVTVQADLDNALSKNMNLIDAFGMAVKSAENFTTSILYAPSHKLKYPDPRAHAVGIWMRAAYEGINQNVMEDGQHECEGCQSIGNVKYLSNEHETRTSFLSAQQSLTQDIWCLLKHACFRSLSCEVHPGKEGVCYFGDEYRGHVLSHTFTLKDAQARGFRKWCSFIVFMRDKQFLLNMWPFLVDNLKEVIRELQDFAEKKYNAEEAECPQRIVRLSATNNGPGSYNNSNKQPRTFSDITNEKHVFIRIHMWLVWILSAGARHFIEIFPMSLLDDELNYNSEHQIETEDGFTLVNAKLPVNLTLNSNEPETTPEFSEVSVYSSLTGVQILVRGPNIQRLESLYGLSSLIPRACRRVKTQETEYMDPNKCNFIGVDTSVAVPLPCASVCRLDIVADEHKVENASSHVVRWTGTLPLKLPTLLIKIEKSLDNEKLGNSTLKAHFAALQEEWANIAKVVHAMRGRGHSGDLSGLMLSLGAGPHDKKLLDAWSMGLPPNPA